VTAADVERIVAAALAGAKPAGGSGDGGTDVGAQLREELARIQEAHRSGRAADAKRIGELEAALKAATDAGGAAAGAAGKVGEKLKKVPETGPKSSLRRVTRFMWGGPDDE
jgi:hypothetical protein